MQPRLVALAHVTQTRPSTTAVPDDVATIAPLGTCNPSSVEQLGHCRDSNGAKLRQTGQANARTDSIVAVRAGRSHRFSRYRAKYGLRLRLAHEVRTQKPRLAARTAAMTSSFPPKSTRTALRPNANSNSSSGSPFTVTGGPLPTVTTG